MNAVLDDFARHWPVYVSMPFVAALIGYVTKRVAIEMMFRPLEFIGIRPLLGWQGVVPKHGGRMAAIATELLTANLLDIKEVFARVDPVIITRELEQPLLRAVDGIARDVLEQHHPRLWEVMPTLAQELLIKQVQASAPQLVREFLDEVRDNLDEVLDVRHMTVERLTRDRALLVRLIRETSRPEMTFIARAGIVFGFVLGLVQALVWALTRQPLVLPIFGGAIGLFTDWLAIKMIFLPREPVRLGRVILQGKFQRRRAEVARQYGELVANEVLTVPNLLDALLRGPKSDRLVAMVERAVGHAVDAQVSAAKPVVALAVGAQRLQEMKHAAAQRALAELPLTARYAEGYLTEAMDVAKMVEQRMLALTPLEFEGLLRPAFRQDEWKLIAVGGVIGFLVGELQVLLMLG
ncbi:DUF445 family protein [Amycolatopsis rubida]|uniref:DUF445 family protein n=1 Tax=Amycolatopsis rubida TaxID=112413 RepID=A0A1I5GGJ5_9PSEU|nr:MULTISPECIES: DUF445 family protein [Amycolatopsis]MYW97536.1 DUF445 family protein [Amycolatopsis rubida]NEC62521.1 DUF445 family protein [Amycolatopsis rubida]OAP27464.1 hypothetical protein A4R44_01067 [Amycolatopsis sp. M39]SFO35020.1 Protein of unknown function [Amycolatopsis rubida]